MLMWILQAHHSRRSPMRSLRSMLPGLAGLAAALMLLAIPAQAQDATTTKPKFDVYGFAQLDFGYQIDRINPDWYDVMRPTKLPAFADEFGTDGNVFMSVRQSRFGVQSWVPTKCRRALHHLRVRHVRRRGRRRPDHDPAPQGLRPARQVRRGPDQQRLHGHRRVPQHARVLGPERHGLLPEPAGALHADPGAVLPDHRAREAGRQRRPGRVRRPHRAHRRRGRSSRCPT